LKKNVVTETGIVIFGIVRVVGRINITGSKSRTGKINGKMRRFSNSTHQKKRRGKRGRNRPRRSKSPATLTGDELRFSYKTRIQTNLKKKANDGKNIGKGKKKKTSDDRRIKMG